MFGDWEYDPNNAFPSVPLEETLEAIGRAIEQGKIRYLGVSNETPYGLTKSLMLHERESAKIPRVVSIQNAYSLLCRTFDAGLTEVCHLEDVSLLPYSPLAMGLLTGKYTDSIPAEALQDLGSAFLPRVSSDAGESLLPWGHKDQLHVTYRGDKSCRLEKYKGRYAEAESRYGPRQNVIAAVMAYSAIARKYGMSPTELALRFTLDHPLTATVIFGASNEKQLQECIRAAGKGQLDEAVREEVDRIHALLPNPTP